MKNKNELSPWQLVDLSIKNNEFLKRLICVHFPFTNQFIRSNMMSLKWGSPVHSGMENFDIRMLITTTFYGVCFNGNVDRHIFSLDGIPFETQHFDSFDWTGIYGGDELPVDKLKEFENYFSKFRHLYSSPSSWDYYHDLDTMTDKEIIIIEKNMKYWQDVTNEISNAREIDFQINSFEELYTKVCTLHPIFILNVNLFSAVKVFLDNTLPDWIEILFNEQFCSGLASRLRNHLYPGYS